MIFEGQAVNVHFTRALNVFQVRAASKANRQEIQERQHVINIGLVTSTFKTDLAYIIVCQPHEMLRIVLPRA